MIEILVGFAMFFLPLIILTIVMFNMRKNARWPEEKRRLTDIIVILCGILGIGIVGVALVIIEWLTRF